MRRIWPIWLALCLLLMGGCGRLPELPDGSPEGDRDTADDTPQRELVFALPYSRDDTLNPYATTTEVNLRLAHLLYDSLTVLTEEYEPQLSLATEITAPDATHLRVTLPKEAVFSDGTAVTVDDVVKSFQQAQKSPNYQTLLSNVTAAKGDSKKRQVTFTLASADSNARACLTFPIVKVSTLTTKAGKAPVGGGLYTTGKGDNGLQLVKNPHRSEEVSYPVVGLRHLPNGTSRYYALASGQIAYYFDDLSEGETPRITGASRSVDPTTLVLLGINSHHAQLANPAMRQALSLLIDRTVVSAVYGVYGIPSASPFPAQWAPMAECTAPSAVQDVAAATELLSDVGKKLSKLRLIYVADRTDRAVMAEHIRTQAKACGITITLTPLELDAYHEALDDGDYELYLGEYRLGADMSLRALMGAYGVADNSAAAAAYRRYLSGEDGLQAFLDAFGTDMPYIPLCYRGGVAAYDRRLTTVTPTGYNPYFGIAGWK